MAGQVISRLTSSGGNDAGVHVISSSFYGICNTAANEKAKVVVISNHNINQIKLVKGMTLNVKFTNDNTATEIPTLAIYSNQSNTDAENPTVGTGLTVPYNIYVKEEDTILPLKPKWSAGSIVTFVYDEFRDNEEVNHPRWIKINSSNEELIDRVNELDNRTQVAVQEVDMEYAPSQSNTEAPTSGWETSISTYTPGWYVWQRTKTLNVGSSTPNYSDPICITGRDGTPGPAGASAYQYSLLCSPSALIRDMNATTLVNVPSAITFSAIYAEGSNTPSAYLGYFDVRQTVDGTNWTTLTSGSGQSSITCTPTTAAVAVKCTLSSQADTNIYLDTQTVPIIETGKDGEDAYTAYLTNDNHSFAATDDNAAVTASVSSQFIVMKGNTSVTATISTITCWPDTALEDGLTVTWANNTFTASVSPSLSVTDYPTGGYLYITASAENQNFEKQFSWLLVPAGADGTNATNFRSISLYKRVAPNTGNPTRPDNELIYNFNTDTLSPIDDESSNTTPTYDGWYRQIPEGSDPCWTIMANALASTTATTDTIAIDDWTSPVMLVKDGEDGLNNATLYLYQRNNTDVEPNLPNEDFTYIFNTGLSPTYQIGNWYGSVSAATITAGDEYYPCWMTTAPVISADNSVLVTSGSWTNPVIYINPARGISDITEKYLKTTASTGVTTATSGWIIPSTTTPIPNPDATNRFIWNYEITTYTDGDTDETTPHIVATYGIDGQSIYSVIDYYKTTTAASLPTKREVDGGPSGSGENGWMTPSTTTPVPQVDKNNKYLWNYERTEYRNPTSTASTAVRLIGAYGDDGIHPTQFVEQKILWDYDDSDLDTHPAPGDNDAWEDGDVIWESNKFIWARTKIIWSDNNPPTHPHITYTNPVLANTYNSISEIAAAANETANDAMDMATSASTSAESAVTSASQALASASTALQYAEAAELAASAAVACADSAYRASISAQTSASIAASAAASAQASANAAASSALNAENSAANAENSAVNAKNSATLAAQQATNASNSAASAQASASIAASAATSAQTSASIAASAATSAQASASQAAQSANTASAAAVNAQNSALLASQRADSAQSAAISASAAASAAVQSANVAVTSASLAVQSASVAATSASQAATSADQAAQSASAAVESASLAAQSASAANIAANSALTQLSIIEDVAGTLDWISKHGSYKSTTDTTVQDRTVYFVRSGSSEPYTYTPVTNPEGNPKSQGWYVLDITDSQSKYIMAHLAVTSAGLWILPSAVEEYSAATDTAIQSGVTYYIRSGSIGNYTYTVVPTPTGNPKTQGWYIRTTDKASGYKTLLSDSGMSIYDNSGTVVATYGEGISFDSNRSFTIGDESASITFNGNGQITISGSGVNIGSTVSIGGLNGAINEAINNLEIGGRNLLGNTENRSGSTIGTNSAAASTFGSIGKYNDAASLYSLVDYDGYSNAVFCATSTSTGNRGVGWYTKVGEIQAGETYTFSCRIKCSIATSIHMHTAWRNGSATAGYTGWTSAGTKAISADTWTDYSYTFIPASNAQLDWEFFVAICITGSSSGATYQVAHAKLEKGTKVTDWSPAPEELQSNAVKRTQRIYYRKSDTGAPTAPTSWVISSSDSSGTWTQKHMPISNTDKYIYTCEQYEMADGKLGNTPILLDDTITVIDGGNIITGSITANAIKAGTITAGLISAGTITAGLIDASNLKVSAANITGTLTASQINTTGLTVSAANINGIIAFGNLPTAVASTSDIPTAVSQLTNDSGYQTSSNVNSIIDGKGYATTANLNAEINRRKAQYGTCSTNSTTLAKVVSCTNFELVTGSEITVKFSYANTYLDTENNLQTGPITLNVNSTGAKNVYVGNIETSNTNQLLWAANAYITFVYDGNYWRVTDNPKTWYGICSIAANIKAKTSTITGCVVCKGTKVELAMTYDNTYEKDASNVSDPPTLNISSSGARNIYFGTGTMIPTKANGTSWLAKSTATFTFDGQYWRTTGKTYLDANSITTGKITADYIDVDDINARGLFTAGSLKDTLRNDITNGVTAYNRATAYRGVCDTLATATTKTVTCDNFPGLSQGIAITVYNTTAQTATAELTLRINSGDAKIIYVNGAATSDTNRLLWGPNSSVTYVYDGNYWRVADNPGGWYGSTCTATEATASKTTIANQAVIFKGTAISVPMTYTNTNTAATLNVQYSSGYSLTNTSIFYGTTNIIPTKENGYAWLPKSELILTYDGKFWTTGHQTFINGGNILANSITAAQIQAGTITAGLINATDLHVDAANIDGTITASKINIRNSLTIGDFTVDAQNLIFDETRTLIQNNLNKIENIDTLLQGGYEDPETHEITEGLITTVNGKLDAGYLKSWLYADENYLALGKTDPDTDEIIVRAILNSEALTFEKQGVSVATYGGEDGMNSPRAVIDDEFRVGDFMWVNKRSNHHISFKYIGGAT